MAAPVKRNRHLQVYNYSQPHDLQSIASKQKGSQTEYTDLADDHGGNKIPKLLNH